MTDRQQQLIALAQPIPTPTDNELYRALADLESVRHAHNILRDALQVALRRMAADRATIAQLRAQLALARRADQS